MILVDTSVWIDFFNGKDLPHVETLESLISQEADIAICGVILTEVLQGIANDKEHKLTQTYLKALVMLEIKNDVWLYAAEIYRNLRKRGLTVRKINDCIIAATALHYDCLLLHNDKDFTTVQLLYPLKIKSNSAL
jgi:predicted nucleic acid-binding protein